jgi:hypothetical protein
MLTVAIQVEDEIGSFQKITTWVYLMKALIAVAMG